MEQLVALEEEKVPSILCLDDEQNLVAGVEARELGLRGRSSAFQFKTRAGDGAKTFEKPGTFWMRAGPDLTTYSTKETLKLFIQKLLPERGDAEALVIGEPGGLETAWSENYRRNIRTVASELGYNEVHFFPEPFAVYLYYRDKERLLPSVDKPHTVLIADIGGGTFDSCVVQTSERGALSRSGTRSRPLGLESVEVAGRDVDRRLLDRLVEQARGDGFVFKDNPVDRTATTPEILLIVEDAKIELSVRIAASDSRTPSCVPIVFPSGTLAPGEVRLVLRESDLIEVVTSLWNKTWGQSLLKTVKTAAERLKIDELNFDRVLIAGGGATLPGLTRLVEKTLRPMVKLGDIVVGTSASAAVAWGLAIQCREQSSKDPRLASNQLGPCLLSNLYLSVARNRGEAMTSPKVIGRVLAAPFFPEDGTHEFDFQLPFVPGEKLFYMFFTSEADERVFERRHNQDDFAITVPEGKTAAKCKLRLEFRDNGEIHPTFVFTRKGKAAKKGPVEKRGKPMFIPDLDGIDGSVFSGIDLGTSNSYVVRFFQRSEERLVGGYPLLEVSGRDLKRLRECENRVKSRRHSGTLTPDMILDYARSSELDFIFHSNKIEGSPLTKGETESALLAQPVQLETNSAREARNLKIAYSWVLENYEYARSRLEPFVREINSLLLHGIRADGGKYREGPVTIGGSKYHPPASSSVGPFMRRLAEEIRDPVDTESVLELAARVHTKFVCIHPFSDGNGRTARLLMNAILLSAGFPPVVINFDDRERYMDTLEDSNIGRLGPLVGLVIECMDNSLTELGTGDASDEDESIDRVLGPPVDDEVARAIAERSVVAVPVSGADAISAHGQKRPIEHVEIETRPNDPIGAAISKKIDERKKRVEADYQAWKNGYEMFRDEAKRLVNTLQDRDDLKKAGIRIVFKPFDILSCEKYEDISRGRRASHTWFFSLRMTLGRSQEQLMFFFERCQVDRWASYVDRVSLSLSRWQSDAFVRLRDEPISLREVGYGDGQLVYRLGEGDEIREAASKQLGTLVGEIISVYL